MNEKLQYIAHFVLDRDDAFDPHDWCPPLDRRAAVRLFGLSALAGIMGCANSAAANSTTTTTGTTATTTGYNRSNILTNIDGTETQTGVPLTLTLYVYDAKNGCAAMKGVQVDIGHCNAAGICSAESSESTSIKSWLRGYQLTDANGMVTFTTILPGWYAGRTTHIHFRLRSTYDSTSNSGTNTMRVFFDQALIDTLDTTVTPYALCLRRQEPDNKRKRPRLRSTRTRHNADERYRAQRRQATQPCKGLPAYLVPFPRPFNA